MDFTIQKFSKETLIQLPTLEQKIFYLLELDKYLSGVAIFLCESTQCSESIHDNFTIKHKQILDEFVETLKVDVEQKTLSFQSVGSFLEFFTSDSFVNFFEQENKELIQQGKCKNIIKAIQPCIDDFLSKHFNSIAIKALTLDNEGKINFNLIFDYFPLFPNAKIKNALSHSIIESPESNCSLFSFISLLFSYGRGRVYFGDSPYHFDWEHEGTVHKNNVFSRQYVSWHTWLNNVDVVAKLIQLCNSEFRAQVDEPLNLDECSLSYNTLYYLCNTLNQYEHLIEEIAEKQEYWEALKLFIKTTLPEAMPFAYLFNRESNENVALFTLLHKHYLPKLDEKEPLTFKALYKEIYQKILFDMPAFPLVHFDELKKNSRYYLEPKGFKMITMEVVNKIKESICKESIPSSLMSSLSAFLRRECAFLNKLTSGNYFFFFKDELKTWMTEMLEGGLERLTELSIDKEERHQLYQLITTIEDERYSEFSTDKVKEYVSKLKNVLRSIVPKEEYKEIFEREKLEDLKKQNFEKTYLEILNNIC